MPEPLDSAKAALASFMEAWNRADIDAVRQTLNYPHVTLGPQGQLFVAREPSEFQTDFARMREREGWDHSTFDEYSWVAESADKVHCEVLFRRFRADGTCYGSGRVLYAVTNHNGHWGMQMRSGMPDGGLQAARGPA
jgi:hypothetical protein